MRGKIETLTRVRHDVEAMNAQLKREKLQLV
jgi:hypothetical protein